MRIVPGSLKDPVLHVACAVVLLLAFIVVLDQNASRRSNRPAISHPSHCHACSASNPHRAHDRDAALARLGAIDLAEIID